MTSPVPHYRIPKTITVALPLILLTIIPAIWHQDRLVRQVFCTVMIIGIVAVLVADRLVVHRRVNELEHRDDEWRGGVLVEATVAQLNAILATPGGKSEEDRTWSDIVERLGDPSSRGDEQGN